MDALLAAQRFPRLAARSMRDAVIQALASRRTTAAALLNDALMRFERMVQREATDGVRPVLLFAERDRIVRELRIFMGERLAARLFALPARDLVAIGRGARPFDAIVRNRRGELYAVAFRRLPADGRRLEWLRRIREAAVARGGERLRGVVVYDFASGGIRRLAARRESARAA